MQLCVFLDCVNNNVRLLAFTSVISHVQDPIKTVSHIPYNIPVRNELLCFLTDLDGLLKSRDIALLTKVSIVKVMAFPVVTFFSSSHIQMWELDYKEGWAPKNWCFQTVALEKILKSLLDSKEIKPVNPKGNQPWIFIGRTDAEVEAPILWPPDVKNWLIRKDIDTGKDWRQEEKEATG